VQKLPRCTKAKQEKEKRQTFLSIILISFIEKAFGERLI